jgi:glycosyltransferase involved in cell wall biosynthesis
MRRVLHIIDSLDDEDAGNQLGLLARRTANEGLTIQIAELQPKRPAPSPCEPSSATRGLEPLPRVSLARRAKFDPLAFIRLIRLVRQFGPEAIHSWTWDAAIYASAVLTRVPQRWRNTVRAWGLGRERPKHVVALHRIRPWTPEWQLLVARQLADFPERLVTSSASVRDWYVSRGLPANKFKVIPAGVPEPVASDRSRDKLLAELRLPADAKLIGVVGRLVPENCVKDLIWAADLLRVLHDNLRVLIIGDGPLRGQLEEYARLASDLEHIHFLGDRPDLWRILPHFDVLWNGSENIGTSISVIQAMAAGVPVVASDTPANRELVVDGQTGYLIPLGIRSGRAARARSTDRMFTDTSLRSRLSHVTQQRATKEFSADRMVSKYWELYSELSD